MSEQIELRRDGRVLIARLVRPQKRNAMTGAMYAALAEALSEAETDPDIRAVAILGDAGCFTAGNDIGDFLDRPPLEPEAPVLGFLRALAGATVPLVAGVDGDAVGIGTTMLLHCDLVLVTGRARLRLPFVDLGLVPEAGSTWLLPRMLGHARAAELLLLGAPFDGARAVALGIANRQVAPDALEAETLDVARALAAKPPQAMRQTKSLLRGERASIDEAMAAELALLAERMVSAEAREAFSAFLEKRPPDFSTTG